MISSPTTSSSSSSKSSTAMTNVYSTPSSGKYCPRDNSYFYIPPCESTCVTKVPIEIDARTGKEYSNKLDIEWVPHTTPVAITYMLISLLSIVYYSACFLKQYGTSTRRAPTNSWLDEACLTRVVLVEWLFVVIFMIIGIYLYRRILMPTYIFLAVIATNGVMVLLILKIKQIVDGKIDIFDISFNLLALLFFCSIIHNIVYLYAMHLHIKKDRLPILPISKRRPASTFYESMQSNYYYADNLMFTYA